ncbi:tetratricopeptide repeat protein [candidate division WOR-3 bacterium]|nr:tetratricopeptide repeat protein [candidate division WOR-3 bacterium]
MITPEELKILKGFAERIPLDDPGAHNNLAIVYYNKGLYDEAISELEEALKIDSNFVLARNNLDIILKKTGRLEEKVERLARVLDKEPYDEYRTLELADTYRKLSRYSQAIIFYKKVLDFNPGSFEGHYGLGMTLKSLGKYDNALEEIKKSLEIKISPEVYRMLGEVYFNKGIVDLAIKNLQEAINLEPASAESHFLLGFAYGEKGKVDDSLASVKKAISLNPALAQFEPNLSIDIKEHKGQWEFLKEQLGMPKKTENEFQVHFNLGMTYRNKRLHGEAQKELEHCLSFRFDSPELYLALGQVYLFQYKMSDAERFLQKAYELDFDSALCTNALGVLFCLKNDLQAAETWFDKTYILDKKFAPAINNKAVCQYIAGNIDRALGLYDAAIKLNSVDARVNKGMILLHDGKYEKALALFNGDTADQHFGRGLVFVEQGKDDDALHVFRQTLAMAPDYAGAYYNIGFILTKQGKFKEGLDFIRRGMEIEPNYEKNKYMLTVDPQLSGFGPYYTKDIDQRVEESMEAELPQLEIPDADESYAHAEEYYRKRDYDNALFMIDQTLSQKPDWHNAMDLKAKILFDRGQRESAITILEEYSIQHPDATSSKQLLGTLFKTGGDIKKAKVIFTELMEQQPDVLEWIVQVADLSWQSGDHDEARERYMQIVEHNKEHIGANIGLLRFCMLKKDLVQASPYVQFLKEKHPDLFDVNLLAGLYHLEKNERSEANVYLQKAIEIDSSQTLPYYHLGLLRVQEGDFESACDNWKKALLLSPEEELAKKIRHCLTMTVELSEFIKKEV